MTVELEQRGDITLEAARRVAWAGEGIVISASAYDVMAASRTAFLRLLEDEDVVVYGVTSGYGFGAKTPLSAEARSSQARRPPHAPATSFGRPLPVRVTRAILLARLANYLEGHAAISPELALAVAEMAEQPGLPRIPAAGNGGAGEIQALSHLLGGLAERFTLGPKDSLSLINGSPCAAALVADAALAAGRRLAVAEEVFALSAEALPMPLAHIAPELEGLWSDPAETETLIRLRQLLAGGAEARRPYQAPVSFRILPRLLARLRRAVVAAAAAAETSLRAVTDNPVFIRPDAKHPNGRVLSNGGFQNAMAWPAMDEIAAAYADLATLAERHQTRLLGDAETGLPDYPSQATAEQPFLGCLPMAAVGFAEAARHAAQRTFLPASEGGGFVQNDVASPNFFAWERQEEAGRMLEATLAGLALIVARAFDDAGREAPPALAEPLAEFRRLGQPQAGPSALGQAGERIAEALRARVYAQGAAE